MSAVSTATVAPLDRPADAAPNGQRRTPFTWLVNRLQRLGHGVTQRITVLLSDERRRQLEALAANQTRIDVTVTERWLDPGLLFAAASLGLAGAGQLFFPPLTLLSIPGVIYTHIPIYQDAYQALRERRVGLDLLYGITQSLILAHGYLLPANLGGFYYFLSRKLLVMAQARFQRQLEGIFGQLPSTVYCVVDGVEVATSLSALKVDDLIIVRAGETIPVDGVVVAGLAMVDQHGLTGESQPAEKGVGSTVFAATVVQAGRIEVKVAAAGATTIVAQIGAILAQADDALSGRQLWAEALNDRSAGPMLLLGGLTAPVLGWEGAQAIVEAHPQRRMLISSSLCTLNYLTLAAQAGILVKDGRALELLQGVDTLVFDKTGTLTLDDPQVAEIYPAAGYSAETVLCYAAAAEARQQHPIARAIGQAAAQHTLPPLGDDADYQIGYGITVTVAGECVRVGSARFLQQADISITPVMQAQIDAILHQGESVVLVAIGCELAGIIALHATLRPEAVALVHQLQQRRLNLYIISGDHVQPTHRLAATLGIEHYFAEVLPEAKAALVRTLQDEGRTVCFVGDGINDTLAMRQAQVAISLRGATTAATDTAHIVLMNQDLQQLATLFDLTRTYTFNLRATVATLLLGTSISITGACFGGFGLLQTTTVNQIVFPLSLGSAMWSRLRH